MGLGVSLLLVWTSCWTNCRIACDLRRCDVTTINVSLALVHSRYVISTDWPTSWWPHMSWNQIGASHQQPQRWLLLSVAVTIVFHMNYAIHVHVSMVNQSSYTCHSWVMLIDSSLVYRLLASSPSHDDNAVWLYITRCGVLAVPRTVCILWIYSGFRCSPARVRLELPWLHINSTWWI